MATTPSQGGDISRSSTFDDDSLNDDLITSNSPSISQLYSDAALYEKILARINAENTSEDKLDDDSTLNGTDGFTELIGRDLNSSEQAVAARFAKLSVASDNLMPSDLTDDPDSYEESLDSDEKTLNSSEDSQESLASPTPIIHRSGTTEETWKLEPEEVISLLIQEFEPLAAEGEEETLIVETDGGLFADVTVIGVIHLTTHRLAFHASLLSARPDLHPSQQIIKSGPMLLHRRGWHSKRRYWVELSHDMMCCYASSRDKDRIKPLRTVLLSSVQEVSIDPKNPRGIRLRFDTNKDLNTIAEVDTPESALDWKKELKGAVFVYRHKRRAALTDEGSCGVRFSIPLSRIMTFERAKILDFTTVASIGLELSQSDADLTDSGSLVCPLINIGPVIHVDGWDKLGDAIAAAKKRHHPIDSPVFLDFGPLTFTEEETIGYVKPSEPQSDEEKAIREELGLGAELEVWITRARIYHSISSTGYFVVSPHFVSFWSKSFTPHDVRYRLPLTTVKSAKPIESFLSRNVLALEIEGLHDLKFEFKTAELRDEVVKRTNAAIEAASPLSSPRNITNETFPPSPTQNDTITTTTTSTTTTTTTTVSSLHPKMPPTRSQTATFAPLSRSVAAAVRVGLPASVQLALPKAINLPTQLLSSRSSLHFVCLTIGSRGDVQPYIALGLGLMKEGHQVTIATHDEYRDWIMGFGIGHKSAGGDPGALMKLSVDNKMFSPEFFKESLAHFRPWLDQLLLDSWEACQEADVLLESPSAMAGVHIAEALNIPYFRTFTMPWTKTAEFPHAFLGPPVKAPSFNAASYVLFENVMWTATSGQINRWRRHTLKIGNTDMGHLAQSKITFIYNFSQAVVPKPLDWGDTTVVSGYWFLDNPDLDWEPPADLLEWMAKAREDGKPIVYIGFGSITVPNPQRLTARIVKAVLKSDVRAIISKGWSARMSKKSESTVEVEIPPECYQLDKVPHDWLFPKIDAALHHGGAGTTGASLRAGIPTLIKPWFGDQYFWASRVQKLGAGLRVPSTHVSDMAEALIKATTSRIMKEKATSVGERIRSEDGVHTAIHAIYTYLPRASLNRASLRKDKFKVVCAK